MRLWVPRANENCGSDFSLNSQAKSNLYIPLQCFFGFLVLQDNGTEDHLEDYLLYPRCGQIAYGIPPLQTPAICSQTANGTVYGTRNVPSEIYPEIPMDWMAPNSCRQFAQPNGLRPRPIIWRSEVHII